MELEQGVIFPYASNIKLQLRMLQRALQQVKRIILIRSLSIVYY